MLKVGNVELGNPWILAPMAGVCDLPFRILCSEMGAGLVCMEMVSAKAIYYKNKNTEELMRTDESEHPVSLQLFGSDPELMGEMAKKIEDRPFEILDFNMGCPVPKVVNNHEGSYLMKEPVLAGKIIESMVKSTYKPVTVKIRKGFNDQSVNAVEIAHIAEESGASAVAVHGRTREQFYSGKADWDIIRQVKDRISIPVIGNGDVTDYDSAMELMRTTGCDGVMIGRKVRGNPWIFKELIAKSEGRDYEPPSVEEIKTMMLRHADLLVEYKGEYIGMREMRKHAAWYTGGMKNSSKLRGSLNEIETLDGFRDLVSRM